MTNQPELRDRIAEALMRWAEGNNNPQYASMRRSETVRANAYSRADAVLAALPASVDRATVLRKEAALIRAHCPDHLDSNSADGSWINCHCDVADDMERRAAESALADTGETPAVRADDEAPLSPDYQHPECGFHWHGRDGMDVPLRDGQPVCPRCELRKTEKLLAHREKRCEELRAESKRRGKIKLEQAEQIRHLEKKLDEVRTQLGAEILRAGQAEAELRRAAAEAVDTAHDDSKTGRVVADDTIWLERRPCGCIVAAVAANVPGEWTLTTAQDVALHFHPTEGERRRAAEAGLTVEPVTSAQYREQFRDRWHCNRHAAAQHPAEA